MHGSTGDQVKYAVGPQPISIGAVRKLQDDASECVTAKRAPLEALPLSLPRNTRLAAGKCPRRARRGLTGHSRVFGYQKQETPVSVGTGHAVPFPLSTRGGGGTPARWGQSSSVLPGRAAMQVAIGRSSCTSDLDQACLRTMLAHASSGPASRRRRRCHLVAGAALVDSSPSKKR